MGILIPRHALTNHQRSIKLFSNPVSGIACHFNPKSNYELAHGVQHSINGIKYSKSMLLGALKFWNKQLHKYYWKIKSIYNPLGSTNVRDIENQLIGIKNSILQVEEMPNSFLFSHRYIEIVSNLDYQPLQIQRKLLEQKYPNLGIIWFEKGTLQPIASKEIPSLGIAFSIFINEYPYIKRAKIAEVGKTKRGNTFIIKK